MSIRLAFLKRPYPLIGSIRKKFFWALSFGIYVFLFLFVFKPFGLVSFGSFSLLGPASAFGAITFLVMYFNLLLLPYLFSRFFQEEQWSVGREILITLIHIFMIGLANLAFARLIYGLPLSLSNFFYLQFIAITLAVIPITLWTLLRENQLLKKNITRAKQINDSLGPTMETKMSPFKVTIQSENKSDHVTFNLEQIYFISSYDNYVRVGLYDVEKLQFQILRSTLKKVALDLKKFQMFYRCHRAYIVNLDKVASVSGNARGLKLKLKKCSMEIPVSRSLNEEIASRLKERSNQ